MLIDTAAAGFFARYCRFDAMIFCCFFAVTPLPLLLTITRLPLFRHACFHAYLLMPLFAMLLLRHMPRFIATPAMPFR